MLPSSSSPAPTVGFPSSSATARVLASLSPPPFSSPTPKAIEGASRGEAGGPGGGDGGRMVLGALAVVAAVGQVGAGSLTGVGEDSSRAHRSWGRKRRREEGRGKGRGWHHGCGRV
ncbi:hypothetical protein PVAP13_8KG277802 [Panicum virgatum]|uniref:Uncharacterized protein n=1 Tax=Panicum virgatum TaxID=38727 RepID=A0A8T0PM73_PANVG|nr:hypothetical protein PVAP13_8KG277802 [Panicum virgatum]